MDIEDYSLAVWKKCDHCKGVGKLESHYRVDRYTCGICKGYGKVPTFIPLEKIMLVIESQGNMSIVRPPETVTAIRQWMKRQGG